MSKLQKREYEQLWVALVRAFGVQGDSSRQPTYLSTPASDIPFLLRMVSERCMREEAVNGP